MNLRNVIRLPQKQSFQKSKSELFFLAYVDDFGYFRFESGYRLEDIEQGKASHQLICLNSFYRKPRSLATLHTLHALSIDVDGEREPFPLSHIDILERWNELGFSKPPSEIIRTSPGRFHVILNLQPLRAFPEKVSYWRKCAEGFALLFKELGADMGATTNPVGFMRIPGHINGKYPSKPTVEVVFESDSMFTLSEIYGVLQEHGLVKKPKKFRSHSDIEEKIKILRQGKFPDNGSRTNNHVCLTLGIYYKEQGFTEEEIFEELSDWNTQLAEPLKEEEIQQILKYTFERNYSLSLKWLDWLTTPRPETSNLHNRKPGREPKRTHLKDHADKIRAYLASHGGSISIAQREFAKVLNVPFESLRKSFKLLAHELTVTANGRGRYATTIITLKEYKKCALIIVS